MTGDRPGQNRLGLAVFVIDHIGDDHGDVVRTAAAQRQLDQPVRTVGDVFDLQRLQDGVLADRIGQAVRAEQIAIAGPGFAHDQGGLDLVTGQRPHDQRTLRVTVCFLGGDSAFVDQGLDEGVVLGDLVELTVAQQIATRVADMDQSKSVAREQDCGERSAHAVEFGLHLDVCRDRRITFVHSGVELAQQVAAGLVVIEVGQRGDHQLRGDLAGGVTAHAVGQGQQPRTRVDRVLVVGAHQPAVAAGGVAQNQRHGRSSIAVLPIRTGVPMGTRTAVVTFALSR